MLQLQVWNHTSHGQILEADVLRTLIPFMAMQVGIVTQHPPAFPNSANFCIALKPPWMDAWIQLACELVASTSIGQASMGPGLHRLACFPLWKGSRPLSESEHHASTRTSMPSARSRRMSQKWRWNVRQLELSHEG